MLSMKNLVSLVVMGTLLSTTGAFAAGKAGKGKADQPANVSFNLTASVGEKSLLEGPGHSTLAVPLLPGGKIDPNGTLTRDLGLVSFSTNDPDMVNVRFSVSAPAQMVRSGGGALDYKLMFDDDGTCSTNAADYFAPGSVPDRVMNLVAMSGQVHLCAIITGPMNTVILKGDYSATFTASAIHP